MDGIDKDSSVVSHEKNTGILIHQPVNSPYIE